MTTAVPPPSHRAKAAQSDGPVQHGQSADNKSWASRPGVAKALRWAILITPSVLSFAATFTLARKFPPYEVGISRLPWWIGLFSIGVIVLLVSEKITRRLLPLAALFKLSLVFPDAAPSRYSLAMKTNSTRKLERRIAEVRENGIPDDTAEHAELMLELVAALSLHDRLTRGHCERVRAYTDMIAEEMKLPEEDAAKLRWSALLHDVGKIYVASEILNKEGRPTEDEWASLKSHTWKGDELIEPLREFLGPWGYAVRNHHERWDGNGYPDQLAGRDIPLGGRIVAVADAFDVMTSARSYKAPRPASEARAEIARCAGGQFDPDVARAFLNIGLGRLRFAVGPLSWLANISAVGNAPSLIGTAATQTVLPFVATAAATVVSVGGFGTPPPEIAAFVAPPMSVDVPAPPVEEPGEQPAEVPNPDTGDEPEPQPATPQAQARVVSGTEDITTPVVLSSTAEGTETIFRLVGSPEHGTLRLPEVGSSFSSNIETSITASYTPDENFNGTDEFRFRACNASALNLCSDAVVTLEVAAVNDPPVANDLAVVIREDSTLNLTPQRVLANATDVDGDELTVTWSVPITGTYTISGGAISYTPPAHSTKDLSISYRVCDASECDEAEVGVAITGVDDAPVANDDTFTTLEDVALQISNAMISGNDLEFDGAATRITWDPHPNFNAASSTFTPASNSTAPVSLSYQLCDVSGPLCDEATVTVNITAQPDSPIANDDSFSRAEDTLFEVTSDALLANDTDPDGGDLTVVWGEPDAAGGTFTTTVSTASFKPPQDYEGTIRIDYQACSGSRCSDPADIVLELTGVNDNPTPADALTFDGTEDIATDVSFQAILADATDVDDAAEELTAEISSPLPAGLIMTPDSTNPTGFSYLPAPDSTDPVIVDYRVCDFVKACTDSQLTLTFAAVDDPPQPGPYTKTVREDNDVNLNASSLYALANDSDSPLEDLTFSFTQTNPTLGTPSYDPVTQRFRYRPNADEHGQTVVTYSVCDLTTTTSCPSSTITVTVTPVDDPPTIEVSPFSATYSEGTVVTFTDADMQALVDDIDTDLADVAFNFQPVADGVLVQNGQGFDFVAPGFAGTVQVPYQVCDAGSCSPDLGQIELIFTPVDDAPQPTNIDVAPFDEDPPNPVVVTRAELVAAAADPDSPDSELTFTAGVPSVDLGAISERPNGDWHFFPNTNANGPTTFPFQVCDSNTDPAANCEPFDVNFNINPVNDKPVISILTTTFPGTENTDTQVSSAQILALNLFSDPDSPFSQLELLITDPGSGLVIDADNQGFTYTPESQSSADVLLTYIVCDLEGACSDEVGEMILEFSEVDDPPSTTDLTIPAIDEDPATDLAITRASLEANTTDPDTALADLTYTVSGFTGDNLGGWSDPGDGGLALSLDLNANGSATYEVDVCDATSCGVFYIDITVDPVNDPPVITSGPSTVGTTFNPPADVVLPDDYVVEDPDVGDTHTVGADAVAASEGTLSLNAENRLVFSPNPTFGGTQVVIPFDVCDAAGDCDSSEWVIDVVPNAAPVFGAITIDQQFINVATNPVSFAVTDADGDTVSITDDTLPDGLSISPSGSNFVIAGTPTNPADLGQTVNYTIDASDGVATTVFNGSITFSDQGLSPNAGDIIFTEIAYDDIRACAGIICEEEMEEAEALNISGSPVSIDGWTLQDHAPGGTPDVNGRVIDLSDNFFGIIEKWPSTIDPDEYVLFSTFRLGGNVTPWDLAGDDLWLLDADGLIVDYVGWSETENPAIEVPEAKLGIWDVSQAAMLEIGGKPDPLNRTTIALATVSDANTAACWEFTATGNAGTGAHVCPAADTTPTIDHPSAQGQFGMRDETVHSLYYPNWQ